jgi:predicted nucleotide-binding protein (sugar kinase/HSP70/actin superfamily)
MVKDFDTIEIDKKVKKPKVGIVGEILIKYHPFGNNYVTKILEDEGAEVILPDFMGFVKYVLENQVISNNLLKTSNVKAFGSNIVINILEGMEKTVAKALASSDRNYLPPSNIRHLATNVKEILSNGNQTGEGWFLTAEMLEYIENGIQNIICVQPFACLPNHVVGKGVIKTIRDKYPDANIVPVDYDPGASETNQTNRIKLLLTVAKDNLKKDNLKEQKRDM